MNVQPWEELDLETHWGWLKVEGKTILDVGADYGSTADFFLAQGAAEVIAVEGDERVFRRLKALGEKRNGIRAVHRRISSVADWQELLSSYPAQVVKVDCEGPEGFLLDVDDRLFRRPEAWAVETHTPEQAERWGNAFPWKGAEAVWMGLLEKFLDCGFSVARDVPHWMGRVVYGVRGDFLLLARPGDSESSVKAVVLGPRRAGTRLLEESLASLDGVQGGGEVLKPIPAFSTRSLRDFFEDGEAPVKVCFLTYDQVSDPLVAWLQMNEVHVIHLVPDEHKSPELLDEASLREHALAQRFQYLLKGGLYLEVSAGELAKYQGGGFYELPLDLACRLGRFLDVRWAP